MNSQNLLNDDLIFMLANKEVPADHDSQICCLGLMSSYVSICYFLVGSILSQGLIIMWAPDIYMNKNPYVKGTFYWITHNKWLNSKLVKVHSEAI